MRNRLGGALAGATLLSLLTAAPGFADTTATWVGAVTEVSTTQISVSHKQTGTVQNKTRRFLIGGDFQGVTTSMGNKKKTLADVKPGMTVQVVYYTDAIAHVDHARKITIVNGFNLNINLNATPGPVPKATPGG
jgi:hypothetical protein